MRGARQRRGRRRALPAGGVVPQNYIFEGQAPGGVPESLTPAELFESGKDTLFISNIMFPRAPDEDLQAVATPKMANALTTNHPARRTALSPLCRPDLEARGLYGVGIESTR